MDRAGSTTIGERREAPAHKEAGMKSFTPRSLTEVICACCGDVVPRDAIRYVFACEKCGRRAIHCKFCSDEVFTNRKRRHIECMKHQGALT